MTTTAAAKNQGEPAADKAKAEKRRALGRGLESLLPGPRVVAPTQAGGAEQQVPHRLAPVRNDKEGVEQLQAESAAGLRPAGQPGAAVPTYSSSDANARAGSEAAELRPAGQPGAAVPTYSSSDANARAGSEAAGLRPAGQPGAAVPTYSSSDANARAGSEAAGLRPAGRPGAAVPTYSSSDANARAGSDAAELRPAGQPGAAVPTWPVVEAGPAWAEEDEGTIELMGQAESRVPGNLVVNLAIADIDKNPFQTRYVKSGEQLDELTASVKANGVLQPIVVRPAKQAGRYILIVGERRMHASKLAGKDHIPAIVRRVGAQQAAEMTIVENLQREDLSPLEQAEAFRVLSTEFSLTQQQIAARVGLSRASVANYMRLLKLPIAVMELLAQKSINFAQAKELLKLEDNDRIAEAAIYAVKKGMTVEQIESLVLRMDGLLDPIPGMPGVKKKEHTGGGARWVDPNVRAAQTDLERMLGVRVRIRDRKGKGKIVIEYSTVDDYDRVVEMLRGKK